MNKMTKGALATGVGVALLLGGGGTLAVWNQTAKAQAGTIAAGDLNLQSEPNSGVWTVNGIPVDIEGYKVVPGETLTYTQNLEVTLIGDQMKADLAVTGFESVRNAALAGDLRMDRFDIQYKDGTVDSLATDYKTAGLTPKQGGTATVTAVVAFPDVPNQGRAGAAEAVDLSGIGFELKQVAPVATTAASN